MLLFWLLFDGDAIVHHIFTSHADVLQILITNWILSDNAIVIFFDKFGFQSGVAIISLLRLLPFLIILINSTIMISLLIFLIFLILVFFVFFTNFAI